MASRAKKGRHEIEQEYVYKGMVLSANHIPRYCLDSIPEYTPDGDVMIASYPKTGATWVNEIVWLIKNKADFNTAKSVLLPERVPYMDIVYMDGEPNFRKIQRQSQPRVVKTHLPASLFHSQLEKGDIKVVVTIRNPKDTLVSLYHFYRMNSFLGNYVGSWNDFYDELIAPDHILYGNFFGWYASWLDAKPSNIIHFVKYEDLKKDPAAEVWKIAKFLEVELAQDEVDAIVEFCGFEAMKNNPQTNYSAYADVLKFDISPFMRKGEVGDWKNYFTAEQCQAIDQQYQDTLVPRRMFLESEI